MPDLFLDSKEIPEDSKRNSHHSNCFWGKPSHLIPIHYGIDRKHKGGGYRDRAPDIELYLGRYPLVFGNQNDREDDNHDPNGKIHQEDPVPFEKIGKKDSQK